MSFALSMASLMPSLIAVNFSITVVFAASNPEVIFDFVFSIQSVTASFKYTQ